LGDDAPSASLDREVAAIYNLGVWARALPVLEELNRLDIPVIVLKSLPQVEDLYGPPGGRITSDVDLVVHGGRVSAVLEAIMNLGWQLKAQRLHDLLLSSGHSDRLADYPWHFEQVRGTQSCMVDLHTDHSRAWSKPTLDPAIWDRAIHASRDGVHFQILCPEDRLVFLCWHFFADGIGSQGFPWHKLPDIAIALERGDIDWTFLACRAQARGVTIFVNLACDLAAVRSANAIVPRWRYHVRPASPWRHARLSSILGSNAKHMTDRQRPLFWLLAHDHLLQMMPVWRHMFFPDRQTIAVDYLGFWPSWPRYFLELARIYLYRVRKSIH
jgi:hypothetical protein